MVVDHPEAGSCYPRLRWIETFDVAGKLSEVINRVPISHQWQELTFGGASVGTGEIHSPVSGSNLPTEIDAISACDSGTNLSKGACSFIAASPVETQHVSQQTRRLALRDALHIGDKRHGIAALGSRGEISPLAVVAIDPETPQVPVIAARIKRDPFLVGLLPAWQDAR